MIGICQWHNNYIKCIIIISEEDSSGSYFDHGRELKRLWSIYKVEKMKAADDVVASQLSHGSYSC